MLPFIPAMIAVTMVLTFVMSPFNYRIEDRYGAEMGQNLLLEHMRSVDIAQQNDLVAGTITDALTGPFRSMGEWQVDVVSGGGKTVVVTYMPRGGEAVTENIKRAFGEIGPDQLRRLPKSYSGTYTYSQTGNGGYIGGGDFSTMTLPVPEKSPALITVINDNYVAPGGGGSGNGQGNGSGSTINR